MEATPTLSLKVFISTVILASLLDMYVMQKLKSYSGRFSSEEFVNKNLAWASALPLVRYVFGDATLAFMKTRTLFFPFFEFLFGILAVISLYILGVDIGFVRNMLFLGLALPLAMISWQDPDGSRGPNVITLPGTAIALLTSLLPGSIGIASAALGAGIGCGAQLGFDILGQLRARVLRRVKPISAMGCVKSAMMIGAFCGFPAVLSSMIISLLAGGIVAVIYLFTARVRGVSVAGARTYMPYVPFQVMGGIITMLWPTLICGLLYIPPGAGGFV